MILASLAFFFSSGFILRSPIGTADGGALSLRKDVVGVALRVAFNSSARVVLGSCNATKAALQACIMTFVTLQSPYR